MDVNKDCDTVSKAGIQYLKTNKEFQDASACLGLRSGFSIRRRPLEKLRAMAGRVLRSPARAGRRTGTGVKTFLNYLKTLDSGFQDCVTILVYIHMSFRAEREIFISLIPMNSRFLGYRLGMTLRHRLFRLNDLIVRCICKVGKLLGFQIILSGHRTIR